jgi:hypothetical protein
MCDVKKIIKNKSLCYCPKFHFSVCPRRVGGWMGCCMYYFNKKKEGRLSFSRVAASFQHLTMSMAVLMEAETKMLFGLSMSG